MRFTNWIALALFALVIGCNNQPTETLVSSDSVPDLSSPGTTDELPEDIADSAAGMGDVAENAEPAMDFGQWLELPEGIPDRISEIYVSSVKSANAGNENDHLDLALVSQQVAGRLIQGDQSEAGYAFYAQAGKALRKAMEGDIPEIPGSFAASVFYNEACALAKGGKTDESATALEDAVKQGFSDFEHMASDTDLASVREIDGFEEKLEEWKQAAAEKIIAHAREELEHGETFPFTFASTDIEGSEQSLDALKGKVVIVDVWGTWCPPCRAEIPSFIKLQEKYGDDGFQMIGLNYERKSDDEANLKAVVDYVSENGINYPCIMGDDEMREQIPDFRGFPTTLFIDRSGKVRMKAVGLHEYSFLDAIVAELLAEG